MKRHCRNIKKEKIRDEQINEQQRENEGNKLKRKKVRTWGKQEMQSKTFQRENNKKFSGKNRNAKDKRKKKKIASEKQNAKKSKEKKMVEMAAKRTERNRVKKYIEKTTLKVAMIVII